MATCQVNYQCSTNRFCRYKGNGLVYCNRHYIQLNKHGKINSTRYERREAIVEGDYAKIPLGVNAKDGFAIVDKEYKYLDRNNWRVTHGRVVRSIDHQFMHRVIMQPQEGEVIDHINGDPLDNRRSNLRVCSQAENARNSRRPAHNTSGYKGVSLENGKYVACIGVNGKKKNLGRFTDVLDAARAYDTAALKFFGEFAKTNYMLGLI